MIDLAAGAGAFSARIVDAGYSVTSNDIENKSCKLTHIPKQTLDLYKPLEPFLPAAGCEAVVTMEKIDHLQNTPKLLDNCKCLVTPDGVILLFTPNVMDIESCLIFLRSGFFFHFSPQSYFATGHRTILPSWLLELIFDKVGPEIAERHWGGDVPSSSSGSIWRTWAKHIVKGVARLLIKSLDPKELNPNYLIYLLRVKSASAMEDMA